MYGGVRQEKGETAINSNPLANRKGEFLVQWAKHWADNLKVDGSNPPAALREKDETVGSHKDIQSLKP